MKYSFWKGFKKALIAILIVGLPIIIQLLPSDIANLTVSGVLLMILNYVKVQAE